MKRETQKTRRRRQRQVRLRERAARRWKRYRTSRNRWCQRPRAAEGVRSHNRRIAGERITPPENWCLLCDPEAALRPFHQANAWTQNGGRVAFDMDSVSSMDIGTAVLLLHFLNASDSVVTTVPTNQGLLRWLGNSGLFDGVRWLTPDGRPPGIVRRALRAGKQRGILIQTTERQCLPEVALSFIKWTQQRLYGTDSIPTPTSRRHEQQDALYRTLVEAMDNTVTHSKRPQWWLGATAEGGRVHFAFVDLGIGLLESARLTWRSWLLGVEADELLAEIMSGELSARRARSATELRHRGLGLPRMAADERDGYLKDLFVLANRGYGHVCGRRYVRMERGFEGTFLAWSVGWEPDDES